MDKLESVNRGAVAGGQDLLRILMIVNLPWDPRLGAVRVWTELSEQWKKTGHTVEKFCLTDAFPRPTSSRVVAALRQAWFPYRAARYLRRYNGRFDVVDCLIGTLPYPKSKLHFDGLVVARSVGLYRSYEQFTRLTRQRWPDQPRGKILGRFFYALTGWHFRRLSDRAIRDCDLINLPNEEEAQFLQQPPANDKPIMIQPYGLNEQNRAAFARAMLSPEERLKKKEICFIGMWHMRKGARDWPEIIRHIRAALPDAQFKLLGTMTDEAVVLKDLGLSRNDGVECIASYEPEKLPELVASCAVGLFPSYIEGFGIAFLEQLAGGIPTVAYDVPGPRQIVGALRGKLLTPPGDARALADRALSILALNVAEYSALLADCRAIADQFRWEHIAADTARRYRAELAARERIVFTEPFGVASPFGGARILRSLLRDAPVPSLCVCTAPAPPAARFADEVHVPLRPSFGRIERTRFMPLPHALAPLFRRRFVKELETVCRRKRARALHAIAHGGVDFHHAYRLSQKMRIPYFLQVHDDAVFTSVGRAPLQLVSTCLAEAWLGADVRYVISQELGQEYNRRYGTRDYVVVTDGLDEVAAGPRAQDKALRGYFMGLFHLVYEPNVRVLIEALESLARGKEAEGTPHMTMRCGSLGSRLPKDHPLLRILPFGSEADVQRDLVDVDWLYLPLPFDEESRAFGAYSLSTKMVTYLGSGLPILYHGPAGTAAHNLLLKHQAAAFVTSPDPKDLAGMLTQLRQSGFGSTIAANALRLARANFLRREQHEKFWQPILQHLNHVSAK